MEDAAISEEPFLFVAWWSFVFTLVVVAIVSVLTRPEPSERLRGLVWGDVVVDERVQQALRRRIEAPAEYDEVENRMNTDQ